MHQLVRNRYDDQDWACRRSFGKPVELTILQLLGIFFDALRKAMPRARREEGGRRREEKGPPLHGSLEALSMVDGAAIRAGTRVPVK